MHRVKWKPGSPKETEVQMKRNSPYTGLHQSPKRLADGSVRVYYYAWKSGPPINYEFGTPEFAKAFCEATASRAEPVRSHKTFQILIDGYQRTTGKRKRGSGFTGFLDLEPRTQADYLKQIKSRIEPEFGTMPLNAVEDRRARGIFLGYRDELAAISRRQADYAIQVLSVILSYGVDRGLITRHPLLKIGRVYDGSRVEKIFTPEMEAKFITGARPDMACSLALAIAIGQRPGDVLRLEWQQYDGSFIRLIQRKLGKLVVIPLLPEVRQMLDSMPRKAPTILCNQSGAPWTYGGFSHVFNDELDRLGIEDVSFGDARGTTVTRLRRANCSAAEIGAITGHSNAEVNRIIEKHYAAYDPVLAIQAINKLSAYYAKMRGPSTPARLPRGA